MRRSALLVIGLLTVALAACSSSGGASGSSKADTSGASSQAAKSQAITVYAAASLTEAFTTLKAQFVAKHPGANVTLTFGASSALAAQITQNAPADVFASAAPKNMQTVIKAGFASSSTNFVSNTGEVAVPPSNPAKVTKLADLAKSSVPVGLCAPAVPCGALATQIFKNAGIKVTPKATFADVKTTLAAVESGNVKAGLVYVTDVKAAGAKVKGIVIPSADNASTEYPIALLKHGKTNTLAGEWVAFVRSAAGQQVLTQDGFAAP